MPEETPELEVKIITPFEILMGAPLVRVDPVQFAGQIEGTWSSIKSRNAIPQFILAGNSLDSAIIIGCCLESESVRNTLLNPAEVNQLFTMAQNAHNNYRTRFAPNPKIRAIWDGVCRISS